MYQLRSTELKRFIKKDRRHKFEIVLVLENIQYAINVANIFRSADAAGVSQIILTGISHKPPFGKDLVKASRNKEKSVKWEYVELTNKALEKLKKRGFQIVALEITDKAINYADFKFSSKVALLVGNETYGVTKKTLEKIEDAVYIPMHGKGASLNVSTAAAITLFKIIEN